MCVMAKKQSFIRRKPPWKKGTFPPKFRREESEANESCQRFSTVIASWGPQKSGVGVVTGGGRFAVGSLKSGILQQCLRVCSSKHWQLKISQKCHKMLAQTFPGVELVFFFFPLPISPPPLRFSSMPCALLIYVFTVFIHVFYLVLGGSKNQAKP